MFFSIQRKFESILPKNMELLSYRHAIDDVCRVFPELNVCVATTRYQDPS